MSTIAHTLADSRALRLRALVRIEHSLKLSELVALGDPVAFWRKAIRSATPSSEVAIQPWKRLSS